MKTPQEWSDFLNKKIACFKVNNKYEYRALNPNVIPFSSLWLQFRELERKQSAMDFYKKYQEQMAKVLATSYYDSLFIITPTGEEKIIQTSEDDSKRYVVGYVDTVDKASEKIDCDSAEWDKHVYEPTIEEPDESNKDVKIAEL